MAETGTICDYSDLLTTECAHCTGAALTTGPLAIRSPGTEIVAQFPGRRGHCDQRYPVGTEIALAEPEDPHRADRIWCHVECTQQPATGLC